MSEQMKEQPYFNLVTKALSAIGFQIEDLSGLLAPDGNFQWKGKVEGTAVHGGFYTGKGHEEKFQMLSVIFFVASQLHQESESLLWMQNALMLKMRGQYNAPADLAIRMILKGETEGPGLLDRLNAKYDIIEMSKIFSAQRPRKPKRPRK